MEKGALNREDFEAIQNNLLTVKEENYILVDKLKKLQYTFHNTTTKANNLEQEISTFKKVISKSKKLKEIESLIQENDSLKKKISNQEKEFRLQNKTLTDELSVVANRNDFLETVVSDNEAPNDGESKNLFLKNRLYSDFQRFIADNQKTISSGTIKEEDVKKFLEFTQKALLHEEKEGLIEANESLVSNLSKASDEEKDEIIPSSVRKLPSEEDQKVLGNEIRANRPISEPDGGNLRETISNLLVKLQREKENYQALQDLFDDRINKKQKSYLALQEKKDALLAIKSSEFEEYKTAKHNEIETLKIEISQMHQRLKSGFNKFEDFKAQKAQEFLKIQDQIKVLNSALSEKKQTIDSLRQEISKLHGEAQKQLDIQDTLKDRIRELEEEAHEETRRQLMEVEETCQKRKELLEELAKKNLEKTEEITKLTAEVNEGKFVKDTLEQEKIALDLKIKECESNYSDQQDRLCKSREENERLNNELQFQKDSLEEAVLKYQDRISNLETQLEISNAERIEFEEAVKKLKQEIVDAHEERKIGEKKKVAHIKILKKSLQSEKTRNEKLQEKIKDVSNTVVLVRENTPTSPSSIVDPGLVEADRSSISSWSMMSGGGKDEITPRDISTPIPTMELPFDGYDCEEQKVHGNEMSLISQMEILKEENSTLREKVAMLENSSSGMAEDLVKKSNIIQHYCMENKSSAVLPSKSHGVEKSQYLNGKKMAENKILAVKKLMTDKFNFHETTPSSEVRKMQNLLEETLMRNIQLSQDLEVLSNEVARSSATS